MSNNVNFIQLESYKSPKISESKKNEWVEFGDNNDYFQYLIDRYNGSTTNSSIINNFVKIAYGKGLTARDARLRPTDWARFVSLVSKDTLKNVITDAKLLGNFAFQLLFDNRGTLVQVEHVPFQLLRAEKCNDKGKIEAYYYSDNWQDTKKFPPKRVAAYGFKGKIQILAGGNYTVGQKYYSNVDYLGALPYAKLEEEIADYLINEVQNSFSPTTVVNFNNGIPPEEEQELITSKVKGTLTGSNGKKVVVAFNSDETKKTTVDSIPLNDAPSHYEYLSDEAMRKIMLGHGVTSPLLFGIATTTGFSSNADELKNSYILYENMVVKPFQQMILDALDKIQVAAEVALDLQFISLQPLTAEGELTKEQVQMSAQDDTPSALADLLINKGETPPADWVLIDENDVDLEIEAELDAEINALNTPKKKNFLQRLASTITARPNSKSEQDEKINDLNFYTRYKYTGSQSPQREFCQRMMAADKIYRKEDIENTDSNEVNPGFGHNKQKYNLFLYKGGPRCHHKWVRQTYVSSVKIDVNNPNAPTISVAAAEKAGYRVRNPREVAMMPIDMPNEGFYPA